MAVKVKISVAIDADILKRIDRVASAKRQSRSAWFGEAVKGALGVDEDVVKVFTDPFLRDTVLRAFSAPGMLQQFARVIGEELSQDQLKLFEQRMSSVVQGEPGAVKKKLPGKKH